MIVAFLGYVFCDFSSVFKGDFSGLIPVLVMLVSPASLYIGAEGSIQARYPDGITITSRFDSWRPVHTGRGSFIVPKKETDHADTTVQPMRPSRQRFI
mgnify:CR=1 FL=1